MSDVEKICCYDRDNNDALIAALANSKNNDHMTAAAMMNGGLGGQWNNPFIYLVWMMFAQRVWGNGYGEGNLQNTEIQNQLNALRTQMQDNQNTNAIMDALKGNGCQIGQLAQSLNCDFNTLNAAICDVRQGIGNLAGQVGFSAERIINSVLTGNLQMTQALKDCCCQTQQSILKMGYDNQIAIQGQTCALQQGLNFVNSSVERGFSNLGFQNAQDKCDIIRAGQDNTQRIIDTLNTHWQSDLQQRYNDARLELSQLKQNATLIAALKTTTPTT